MNVCKFSKDSFYSRNRFKKFIITFFNKFMFCNGRFTKCRFLLVYRWFFFQAYVVLGQYLLLKKEKELFQEWLKDTCSANSKQSSDCYQCLNDWCEEFL